jgi:hypothetical protein
MYFIGLQVCDCFFLFVFLVVKKYCILHVVIVKLMLGSEQKQNTAGDLQVVKEVKAQG